MPNQPQILRYTLELVEYQQLQPMWPGRILSVKPGRLPNTGRPLTQLDIAQQKIDVWAIANPEWEHAGPPPVLGVWILGTGNPWPMTGPNAITPNAMFHDTAVMANNLVWHVFSDLVGYAPESENAITATSVDDMAAQIRERHAKRRLGITEPERGY